MECFEGSEEPLRGWIGHRAHDVLPAPQIEFRYRSGKHSADSAVLIVPFKGSEKPDYRVIEATGITDKYLHTLRLGLPDGSEDTISWTRKLEIPIEDGKPFVTDAPFVWLRSNSEGRPEQCFILEGSYLDHNAQRLLSEEDRGSRLVKLSS